MSSLVKDFTIVENDSKKEFHISKSVKTDVLDVIKMQFRNAMNQAEGKVVMKKHYKKHWTF